MARCDPLTVGIMTSHTTAKIILDARYIGPHTSGIGRYTQNLVRELLELDSGLKLHLICDPAEPQAGFAKSPHLSRLSFETFGAEANSLRTRHVLGRRLDFKGVDIFHSPFNILPAGIPTRKVFTLHDIMWLLDVNYCTNIWWRKIVTGTFYRTLIPKSVHEADQIMTVSHASREAIEDYFPDTKGRVHVTYNAVDPYFQPLDPEIALPLLKPYFDPHSPFVLVVGQGTPYKNHKGALAGFIEAFEDVPDMKFVLVRRLSRTDDELSALRAHPAMEGRIIQLEHVKVDVLRALYSMAHIFLFPSTYEGFGLPALEAMACGTPVVTSNYGAMAEVAGGAAQLVDPRDTASIAAGLRALWDDPEAHKKASERAVARAAEFSWSRCAQQALDVYTRMLGGT